MTCKDCICYDILCKDTLQDDELQLCDSFKNKADYKEVKHGYWVQNEKNILKMKEFHKRGIGLSMANNSIFWTCSCCGTWGTPRYKYCMECGAKMDGKDVNVTTARGNENGNK